MICSIFPLLPISSITFQPGRFWSSGRSLKQARGFGFPALPRADGIELGQTPEQLGKLQLLLFLSLFNFCTRESSLREEPARLLPIIYFNFPL